MDSQRTFDRIVDSGVVAVLRGIDESDIVPVARAMYDAGVTALEVTADNPRCSEMIAAVDEDLADTDAVVGAGTVMDAATARDVIHSGAEFVLAPNLNQDVLDVCEEEDVVAIPGVMTPTEAARALDGGADMLKLFPASTVGPDHIGALQGPLGDVPIMPTGGVSAENVASYFDGGAIAVGAGSGIVDYEAIADGDMDAVREHAATFTDAVSDARSN
jgi:2-dehydro-3-deoxyphosphogluconate aldolase/(4S)-4-hydroxy-2-oxoglutarate aldolase